MVWKASTTPNPQVFNELLFELLSSQVYLGFAELGICLSVADTWAVGIHSSWLPSAGDCCRTAESMNLQTVVQFPVWGLLEQLRWSLGWTSIFCITSSSSEVQQEALNTVQPICPAASPVPFNSSCYCLCHWAELLWLTCGRLGAVLFFCFLVYVAAVERVMGIWS